VATTAGSVGTPASTAGGNSAACDPNTGNLWTVVKSGDDGFMVGARHQRSRQQRSMSTAFFSLAAQPLFFIPALDGVPALVGLAGQRWLAVDHYVLFIADDGRRLQRRIRRGLSRHQSARRRDVGFGDGHARRVSRGSALCRRWRVRSRVDPLQQRVSGRGQFAPRLPDLAEVVTDLSLRAGLTAGQIDVTQLTDQVDGYIIANQVSVKDALALLMPAYYFDAAEDQGKIKFVKRGGDIAVVIPDDDLGAHPSDEEGSDLYETTRVMDEELPSTLSVNYVLAATKYSPASKYARRLVGYSGDEQRLEFAMVFSDQKALQIAHVNLHDQWVSRLSRKLSLGMKYAYLMPTDLIGVSGYVCASRR
jgi:hypothetical protein